MKLSNKMYDKMKFASLVLLPAITALIIAYATIGTIWDWPFADIFQNVSATMVAIDTLTGVLVDVSRRRYEKENNNGEENTEETENRSEDCIG